MSETGHDRKEHDKWYEIRRQQHRAYWRIQPSGRDYEVFPTEDEARLFIGLCKRFGRAEIVTRHRARATR